MENKQLKGLHTSTVSPSLTRPKNQSDTNYLMVKPNLSFIVPGFSKCGTTTLCSLLDLHPDIYIPEDKEPLFFIRDDYEQQWQLYNDFFNGAPSSALLGEGTTFYSAIDHEVDSRKRILKHYPDIRIIFISRDPISRIESSYREMHHSGPRFGVETPYNLYDALHSLPSLISDTMYWSRLSCYKDYLPENKIHILFLEDLKSSPKETLKKCFQFLGVKENVDLSDVGKQLNSGDTKLYDRKILRLLRSKGFISPPDQEAIFKKQNEQLLKIGLRKRFNKPITWSPEAKEYVLEQFGDDLKIFLSHCNRNINIWPRFKEFCNQ